MPWNVWQLIILSSDNGTAGKSHGISAGYYEGGVRVPAFVHSKNLDGIHQYEALFQDKPELKDIIKRKE